ncbi:N-methyl-L-tryptophan oxidase [Haloterrigena sp. SYSU A121-1]|uniref:N-methyl-L-tryptophan oxidase n=1 Tax=Haloterrigena gelatinilytica TaxID=2741724 RepID=A0A8J8KAD7_9EURY|nr:N-methyl-L-tryptophan oxidase [Haloterrigena gelatinilytica]NUB90130.1 N-methyl-L-tryptophan oxidase [Haloterrigena gelatinilytica]
MVATGTRYDVIVIGVGGIGSATAAHLADRGCDVLGLERYDVPHSMGSSHGITRIIRRAYYEHPSYIPLVERAYELWDDLAEETGRDVIHRTGSIDAGPPDNVVFEGSLRSCEEHDIPHEVLTSAAVAERFPGYDLPEGYKALYQPDGGFVVPEQAIVGHVETAQAAGAEVRARERVLEWEPTADEGVRVETDRGTYEAENMVLAAGAWNYKFTDVLEGLAVPERQVLGWFQPDRPSTFEPENFPVWNLEVPEGRFYGLPIYDVPGFKIGKYHHRDEEVDPDDYEREPNREDERLLREVTENYFTDAAGPTMRLATCMFTNSPDEHFILDTLPEHPQVVVGAGFSGHGFKFASVIGEILADLAVDGDTDHPIDMFRLDRFDA